jgi:hypothetical protein
MAPSNVVSWSLVALCTNLVQAVPTVSVSDATLVRRNGCIGQGPGYCNLVLGGQPTIDRKPFPYTLYQAILQQTQLTRRSELRAPDRLEPSGHLRQIVSCTWHRRWSNYRGCVSSPSSLCPSRISSIKHFFNKSS